MSITWLHLSDFHIRSDDSYDRDVVLHALVQSVSEYRRFGRAPDLIFATGDIANSGKAAEYGVAETFFDDLLTAAGLERSRLFVVPGNHDIDRDFGIGLARTLDSVDHSDAYFRPDLPKPHITQKTGAYIDWQNRYFEGCRPAMSATTCGPVQILSLRDCKLGILPINSAAFCQDDQDHNRLWVGRRCLEPAVSELKRNNTDLNIALIHHPLDWLSSQERAAIQALLEDSVDVLLRGHLHETRLETIGSAEDAMLRFAAGATYQTRVWAKQALYCTFDSSDVLGLPDSL